MKNKNTHSTAAYVALNKRERRFLEKEIPRLKASDYSYDKLDLGFLYDEGCIVQQDKKRAAELYLQFINMEFLDFYIPVEDIDEYLKTDAPDQSDELYKEYNKEVDIRKVWLHLGWAYEHHLGYYYMYEHKPAPDYARAAYWFRKFIKGEYQGVSGAVSKVYMRYCLRRDIPPHPIGYDYYLKLGNEKYMEYLDRLEEVDEQRKYDDKRKRARKEQEQNNKKITDNEKQ